MFRLIVLPGQEDKVQKKFSLSIFYENNPWLFFLVLGQLNVNLKLYDVYFS